jgi:membrane-bound serine protease (ClpP class)
MIINKEINSVLISCNSYINKMFQLKLHRITLLSLLLVWMFPLFGMSQDSLVYKIEIREEIGPGIVRKVNKAFIEAENLKADAILLHINTYGGLLDAADSIRTRILNSKIPVIAFIDNNAASAGALISIACNEIYMRSGASMGAATVVDANAAVLPDKYQSYMRAMMRTTAEKRGRDPKIAEAMVDPRTYIPGVNDSGKVLTFTTTEAIKNGYCNGVAESVEQVLSVSGRSTFRVASYQPTFLDNLISILVNPAVSGILLLLMLGGIYFELQSPGIGFPLLAAFIAAILYFAPLYLEGLAANWEILMAIIGLALLAVEIFVLPGFGIAGISGLILLVTAFTISMVGNDGFDFEMVDKNDLLRSLAIVLLATLGGVLAAVFSAGSIVNSRRFAKMVHSGEMKASEGFVSTDNTQTTLVGKTGITISFLRPSGKVTIDGKAYSANAESGFIETGKEIVVSRFDGLNIWVRETENQPV